MALEKVRDLLASAEKANTSIIAFDACDYNTIYACIKGAEIARRPVIVMLYPSMSSLCSIRKLSAYALKISKHTTAVFSFFTTVLYSVASPCGL